MASAPQRTAIRYSPYAVELPHITSEFLTQEVSPQNRPGFFFKAKQYLSLTDEKKKLEERLIKASSDILEPVEKNRIELEAIALIESMDNTKLEEMYIGLEPREHVRVPPLEFCLKHRLVGTATRLISKDVNLKTKYTTEGHKLLDFALIAYFNVWYDACLQNTLSYDADWEGHRNLKTIVNYLINSGASVNFHTHNLLYFKSISILDRALRYLYCPEIARTLIQKGANVRGTSTDKNPLILTITSWKKCDNTFDGFSRFYSGDFSPIATKEKRMIFDQKIKALVRLQLESGANINQQDEGGRTPLMHALEHPNLTMAIRLIEEGADVTVKGAETYDAKIPGSSRIEQTCNESEKRSPLFTYMARRIFMRYQYSSYALYSPNSQDILFIKQMLIAGADPCENIKMPSRRPITECRRSNTACLCGHVILDSQSRHSFPDNLFTCAIGTLCPELVQCFIFTDMSVTRNLKQQGKELNIEELTAQDIRSFSYPSTWLKSEMEIEASEKILEMLKEACKPGICLSLQSHCRKTIRQKLNSKVNLMVSIDKLGIPKRLKDFLAFDLDTRCIVSETWTRIPKMIMNRYGATVFDGGWEFKGSSSLQ